MIFKLELAVTMINSLFVTPIQSNHVSPAQHWEALEPAWVLMLWLSRRKCGIRQQASGQYLHWLFFVFSSGRAYKEDQAAHTAILVGLALTPQRIIRTLAKGTTVALQ